MSPAPTAADEVVEACADALLCAAVAANGTPNIDKALARARAALLGVVERTLREGGRPR